MSNLWLRVLTDAITAGDVDAVRRFCAKYLSCRLNRNDLLDYSRQAALSGNLEIFKIIFEWTGKGYPYPLFTRAVSNNILPVVQYLYPLAKKYFCESDELDLLEETNKPGFEELHSWLEQEFQFQPTYPYYKWQQEWGFDLEGIFTQPALHQMEAELNARITAGEIDEDGYLITDKPQPHPPGCYGVCQNWCRYCHGSYDNDNY